MPQYIDTVGGYLNIGFKNSVTTLVIVQEGFKRVSTDIAYFGDTERVADGAIILPISLTYRTATKLTPKLCKGIKKESVNLT